MARVKKEKNEYYQKLLQQSEIKRIGERLTKSELTNILDIHYNFYWNCVTGRNEPSKNLAEALEVYLKTPTAQVYETIFARRDRDEKDKRKRTQRDENGKEIYHEKLEIDDEYEAKVIGQLVKDGLFKEPKEANMKSDKY
ncbi:hypothetical protein [Viridibacillus arvi]|uniref:hypothetical protein n=1 Tax=Viridibacillus arvi TaxID=263475 RepID=UPI0034CFE26D